MSDIITEQQINVWVKNVLQKENIENYILNISGGSDKGEGYTTDVIFLKINGKKKFNQENVQLDMVLKVSKVMKSILNADMQELYKRELLVYAKIFPALRTFEKDRNVKAVFSSVPKCYDTLNTDGRYIIFFENLRTKGYIEHDRFVPMNISHMKLVLKNYAKFHAISFAFKDQNEMEFKKLIENYSDVFYKLMLESPFSVMFQPRAISTNRLVKNVDEKMASKINTLIEKGVVNIMLETFKNPPKESIIRHGDCWNSNFVFKYGNGDMEHPTEVAILDWQVSSYHSPALDLAYFMFSVSSKEQVAHFDELLVYYHDQLSHFISELGSNPKELFPFSTLLEHWKKYSIFGFVVVLSFLPMIMCKKEDVMNLVDFETEEDMVKVMMETEATNNDLFLERVLSAGRYYFKLDQNNA